MKKTIKYCNKKRWLDLWHRLGVLSDYRISNLGNFKKFKITNLLIKEENLSVIKKDFIEGRSNILESFLNRPRIYLTDYFYNKYEVSARKNIKDSITEFYSN